MMKGDVMKKIEISIREVNLDDTFIPIEHRTVVNDYMLIDDDETRLEYLLPMILINRWSALERYFLKHRNSIPFRPIRRDYENKAEN